MIEDKIIFTNNPIEDIELDDYIGIEPYVETIEKVLEKSRVLALTGDFGSGKSSIINALEKRNSSEEIIFKKVTLLHYINKEKKEDLNSIDLLKILIQSFTDDNSRLKSYVNKKMSNYGELSFSQLNKIDFSIIIKFVLFAFLIYLSSYFFDRFSYLNTGNYLDFFTYFIPILFFLSKIESFLPHILLSAIIYSVAKSEIVFSLWDSQGKKKENEEEIIDLFYSTLKKEFEYNEYVERIVLVIEDSDRIEKFTIISDFLKIIYRISQLKIEGQRKLNFIIPIREEFLIKDEAKQNIYPKIFDIIVNIKKMHSIDYKEVIKKMLNSKSYTQEFKEIFKEELVEFPYEIGKILDGEELDLRKVKNRLNSIFQIYRNIKNLDEKIQINLKACSYIAFLECEYPTAYNRFVSNEKVYNKVFQNNNARKFEESDFDLLYKGLINSNKDELLRVEIKNFIDELKKIQVSSIFDSNMRMYFFRYPKGSYVFTESETRLMSGLSENEVDFDFTEIMSNIFNSSIMVENIKDHLKLLKSFNKFPDNLVFKYNQLVISSLELGYEEFSLQILSAFKEKKNDLNYICDRLISLNKTNNKLINKFILDFSKLIILNSSYFRDAYTIVEYRYLIRDIVYNDRELHKLLYGDDKAIVTEDELKEYSKVNIGFAIDSININRIDSSNLDYIIKFLIEKATTQNRTKIMDLMNLTLKKGIEISDDKYLRLVHKFELIDFDYQKKINLKMVDYNNLSYLFEYTRLILKNKIKIDMNLLTVLSKVKLDKELSINLLILFYNNKFYEKVIELIPLIGKNINLDLSNQDIAININSFLSNSIISNDVIESFRLYMIKTNEHLLHLYKELFSPRFLKLTADELRSIKSLNTINEHIKLDSIDTGLYNIFIQVVNSSKATESEYEKFIFKISNAKNSIASSFLDIILLEINFSRFNINKKEVNTKFIFFDTIYQHFQKTTLIDRLVLMTNYNLVDTRELKKLENKIVQTEYLSYIQTLILNESFTNEDLSVLDNIYFDAKLDDKIEIYLSENKNINYFSSRILKEEIEIASINNDVLINLFKSTKLTRSKLLESLFFVLLISKLNLLNECQTKEIYDIAKLEQNKELIEYIFNFIIDDKDISAYISEVKSININEEVKIVDFIVKEKNLNRLSKSSINQFKKLLSRGQKGKITKHLNKYGK